MGISGLINTEAFPDRTPNRNCWLLFRAGSLTRLKEFRSGKMYMNSVQFFSNMPGEPTKGLRKDVFENKYIKLHSKIGEQRIGELLLDINGEEISLGDDANFFLDRPTPENIFIFCMAALADGPDGKIPGEVSGEIKLSKRFSEFGDHVLIVNNNLEFSKRLNTAINSNPYLLNSDFFEGGYGLVDYVDMATHNGIVGLFRKDMEYSWQREFRFSVGANSSALNHN